MQVEIYQNEYKHKVAKCPFCEHTAYVREISKTSPDPLRELKRHITHAAKNEAFSWALAGVDELALDRPHLAYYKEHTHPKVIHVKNVRIYDTDMQIKQ